MAQEIIVSRPKQKVDTRIYILSDADLRISPAEFDATPFDMLSRHDFKITEADYKEASYVLYVSPEGLMKVIKERKTISH